MASSPRSLTEDAKEVEIHNWNEKLCDIARAGDLDDLNKALKLHPKVLDEIDKIPFVHTPLHEAAAHRPHPHLDDARWTQFALELLNLKPSFSRKLNTDWQSPLHLALQNGFSALAKRLIKYDSELIRVKGREWKTPLHCVAEIGDQDSDTGTKLLAEFLCACPESINDLTIRDETAFHIAVKHRHGDAFKLIFEWIWRGYHGEVLNMKDEDGNTVLHIAASTNQLEIVRYLVRRAPIINNEINSRGKTALAIAEEERFERIKDVLVGKEKVKPSREDDYPCSKSEPTNSLYEFLLSPESWFERFLRFILYCRRELSLDMRNIVLVVAVLIATATYQDLGKVTEIQSPKNTPSSSTNTPSSPPQNSLVYLFFWRTVIKKMGNIAYYCFNTIAFTCSVAVMMTVLTSKPFASFLHLALVFLAMSYGYKTMYISKVVESTAIPLLLIILLIYFFKMIYFKNMERRIKMVMPAIWILEFRPRWQATPPVPVPVERLRMVYQLMRG